MDRLYARRLEHDDQFRAKIAKLIRDYVKLGEDTLNFYAAMFDAAHDVFQGYAQMTQEDMDKLDRGHPRNFILPMSATQLITMATSISQALFGSDRVHRVEGRSAEDENPAELMNQLLRWNDEQQPTYALGYMWVLNSLLYNRGIFYENYEGVTKPKFDSYLCDDPFETEEIAALDESGQPIIGADGQPLLEVKPVQFTRYKKRIVKVGGMNKLYIVSPYEFICDPTLPLYRLQEMRFCGHRKMIPWLDLKTRSQLPIDDEMYVCPKAVENLKRHNTVGVGPSTVSSARSALESRTAYERTRSNLTPLGVTADKEDGGVIEVYEMWIKLIPSAYGIEEDDATPTTYHFLIGNKEHVLSMDMSTYQHDEFPYSIGEPRPSPHYQFSPSWAMQLLPLQNYVDYLKNRHQEALANTVGNIFIAKGNKVDFKEFLDPKKEGRIITVLPEAGDTPLRDIIQQVPIVDVTKDFVPEMDRFINFGDLVAGSSRQMQGQSQEESATGGQQALDMAKGRMAMIARLLSVTSLVPQTKRFVSNFQQYTEEEMYVRIRGDALDIPKQLLGMKGVKITRDTIQGTFDFLAADGTLPGLDTRTVAAITKVIETGSEYPQIFENKPGNLDLRRMIYAGAKAAGLNVEKFIIGYTENTGIPPLQAPGQNGPTPGPAGGSFAPPAPGPGGTTGGVNPPSQDLGGGLMSPSVGLVDDIQSPQVRPQNV